MRRAVPGPALRWGIIGAGNIARHAIAPAIRESGNGVLAAVASRDLQKAKTIAQEIGAARAHGSYEALLTDLEIDAVYIATPTGLHEETVLAAARAGKHILCEKALTLDRTSATRMRDACDAAGVLLAEAFMYRHHPQWPAIHEIMASGVLGEIRSVFAHFHATLGNPNDHRWSAKDGGGTLGDLTCYTVNACRYVLRAEPLRIVALADLNTPERVDRYCHAMLEFPGGVFASIAASLASAFHQELLVIGTAGKLIVEKPFIPADTPPTIRLEIAGSPEVRTLPVGNHFLSQVQHFAACALDPAKPIWPAEDGWANTQALMAVRESWESASLSSVLP